MKKLLLLSTCFVLSGCFAGASDMPELGTPSMWQNAETKTAAPKFLQVEAQELSTWWQKFADPQLDDLIEKALANSPDRQIAKARVLEARGLRRTQRSALLPEIGASASKGREKGLFSEAGDTFDARFDASYEIDIFGQNRNRYTAANRQLESLEATYQDVSLTLVAEIARNYIEMRGNEKQMQIALDNLKTQEQTLDLVKDLKESGENPQLDVERAENLVNTTRASIPEFKRLAENARLRLAVLVGMLPEELPNFSDRFAQIPGSDVAPVLMAPADILALRPDIRAASANLRAQTDLAEAATAEIFPTFSLSGFFGAAESGFADTTQIWGIALGTAVTLLDFGRIEGQIDAARAREQEAYQLYRKTVLEAVSDVETALNDYAHINEQAVSLFKAYENAEQAFTLSQELFKEGEISFLDILDVQRTVNNAQSAYTSAETAKAAALIRLYKSMGVAPENGDF